MTSKKEIIYLLQVALPFLFLSLWKSPLFLIPVVMILISLSKKSFRQFVIRGWQNLGQWLGKYISPIILSAVYYLALTPLAWLRKLTSSDALELKRPSQSTLKLSPKENTTEHFNDLW